MHLFRKWLDTRFNVLLVHKSTRRSQPDNWSFHKGIRNVSNGTEQKSLNCQTETGCVLSPRVCFHIICSQHCQANPFCGLSILNRL